MPMNDKVCVVCGGKFSVHIDGVPYCNKHYCRIKKYGSLERHPRKSTNKFEIIGNVLKITTANGCEILADAEELEKLKRYSWCVSKQGYAVANVNGKVVKINRYILGLDNCEGKIVDHINRNKLDNRKANLRFCTQKDNARNISVSKNSKSKVLGVRKTKHGTYNVRIVADRKEYHIGNFETIEDAIFARHKAEIKYHGKFASHLSHC